MTTIKQAFKLSVLPAVLLAAYGPAFAEDDEIAQLTKPDSSVSVGIGNWSNNRPQQGIYDGMRSNGAYGLLDADIVKRDDATGTWLNFSARNLGTDARELGAGYERQGDFGARLRYNELSRDNPFTFYTGTLGIGTTTLITPAAANPARTEVTLGTKRKQFDLDVFKHLLPGLELNINFKNENKDGTRQWGRGGAPEFSVEPIDATTRQLEVTLNHAGKNLQLSGGYYGSWYKNGNSLVTTQLSTLAPASRYYLSLPLDNQAHQLFLDGGYNFTPTTRGTFKVQYSRATQDEHLPTSDIPGLSLAGAPTSLNGRVDTSLLQFGLTSRPIKDLSVVANLRYHKVDDKTPQERYVRTASAGHICDSAVVNNIVCVDNTPMSYKTLTGKLEGTYRLPYHFSLIGGVDLSKQDRALPAGVGTVVGGVDDQRYVPFRTRIDETTYRLQLRRSMTDTLNGSVAYLHSKRDGNTYSRTNEAESDEINPIHIADRTRNKWRLAADWTPVDALAFQANYENARDAYDHSATREYGLRDGKASMFSLDATYTISRNWQVTAWYSRDDTSARQIGQRAPASGAAAAVKDTDLEEVGNALGIGIRGKPAAKLNFGADLQYTKTVSKYDETLATAGTLYPSAGGQTVRPLNDITNKIFALKLFGEYSLDKNATLRVDLIHERWKTDDWSWMFANGAPFTYGTTTDGTQVLSKPKQTSDFIGVRYIYKFQ